MPTRTDDGGVIGSMRRYFARPRERGGVVDVLGPPRPAMRLLAWPAVTFLSLVFIVVPISDQGGLRSFFGYMLVLALVVVGGTGLATARIESHGEALHIVDVLTERVVKRDAINDVTGDNGVIIRLRDGTPLEPVAYGSSVLQLTLPSSRYRRVAQAVNEWAHVAGGPQLAPDAPIDRRSRRLVQSSVPVDRSARRLLTWGLPVAVVGAQILGVLLWSANPVLHPWMSETLLRVFGE